MLTHTQDMAKTSTGTPYYLSPEICSGYKYDFKSDLWTLGCVLYEMISMRRPFQAESLPMVIKKIIDSDPLPLSEDTSPLFISLCDQLLNKDASVRPSIEEILAIPQIKERIEDEAEEEEKVQHPVEKSPATETQEPKTSSGTKPNLVLDHGFSDEEEEVEYSQSSFLNQFQKKKTPTAGYDPPVATFFNQGRDVKLKPMLLENEFKTEDEEKVHVPFTSLHSRAPMSSKSKDAEDSTPYIAISPVG